MTTHSGQPKATLEDVDALRDHVRKQAATEQGGIVQADIIQVDDHTAAYFITKDTIPNSMGYRDVTHVGRTGKREAFLGVQLNLYANANMEEIPPEAPPIPGSPPENASRV